MNSLLKKIYKNLKGLTGKNKGSSGNRKQMIYFFDLLIVNRMIMKKKERQICRQFWLHFRCGEGGTWWVHKNNVQNF